MSPYNSRLFWGSLGDKISKNQKGGLANGLKNIAGNEEADDLEG